MLFPSFPWALTIGAGLAALCLGSAFRAARRKRLVNNLPTSPTTGVFIGLVELKGTAEAEAAQPCFLADLPCVYHRWEVQERWTRQTTETVRDAKGNTSTRTKTESGWKTVAKGGRTMPFYLRDDAGVIRIQPEGAEIHADVVFSETCSPRDALYYAKGPRAAIANSDHRRRFAEYAIPLHASIYVMGQARERDDMVAPEIAANEHAPVFLISTRTEEQVAVGHAGAYWGMLALGLLLALGAMALQLHLHDFVGADHPRPFVHVAGAFAVAVLLGWTWMAYNSLVELRQRVRQAWANIDVQLKRRAELIPRLVETVVGLRDHERTIQTQLARLRAETLATTPGQAGPEPSACGASIAAIVEHYPELVTNDAFLALSQELAATEDRIAMARDYFNSIATFYNTRLETLPEMFVARLGGLRRRPLMDLRDFEREPISISLQE
ncbi:MAG: LemA family protein [Kiritimatiellia bacterium]|jgi:hypothetical protein